MNSTDCCAQRHIDGQLASFLLSALAFRIRRRSGGIRMNFTKPFFERSNSVPDALSKLRKLSGTEHKQSDREDDQQVQRLKDSFKHVTLLVTLENEPLLKLQNTACQSWAELWAALWRDRCQVPGVVSADAGEHSYPPQN